jgi:hypothetical protein
VTTLAAGRKAVLLLLLVACAALIAGHATDAFAQFGVPRPSRSKVSV